MGKRVIRLTESDLIRLVKKVIREQEEDWTDNDETEYSSVDSKFTGIRGNMAKKAKEIQSRYRKDDGEVDQSDDFYDEIGAMYDDPDYIETNKKRDDLSRRRRDNQEKLRYNDVVKNRPSNFDVDKYSSEYDKILPKIQNLRKGHPTVNGSAGDVNWDEFGDKINKFDSSDDGRSLKNNQDRRDYLRKNLDRDYTHPSQRNRK